MKDLTLKFHDKLQFKAFLSSLGWAEDEDQMCIRDRVYIVRSKVVLLKEVA